MHIRYARCGCSENDSGGSHLPIFGSRIVLKICEINSKNVVLVSSGGMLASQKLKHLNQLQLANSA